MSDEKFQGNNQEDKSLPKVSANLENLDIGMSEQKTNPVVEVISENSGDKNKDMEKLAEVRKSLGMNDTSQVEQIQTDELAEDPSWTGQTKLEKNIEDKEINYKMQLETLEKVLKSYRDVLSKPIFEQDDPSKDEREKGNKAYLAELEKYSDQLAKIHDAIYGDKD